MNPFFQLIIILAILFLILGIGLILSISNYYKKPTKGNSLISDEGFKLLRRKNNKDVKDLSIKELYSELRELRGRVVELNEECLKRESELERNYNNNSPYNGNRTI